MPLTAAHWPTRAFLVLLGGGLAACGPQNPPIVFGSVSDDGDGDTLEEPEQGFQVRLSDLQLEPNESAFFCQFGTYRDADAGVVGVRIQETLPYTHHTFLLEVPADAEVPVPDGVTFPCTEMSLGEQMLPFMPLFNLAGEIDDPLSNRLNLPDDFAVKLDRGQRFVIETHYVNTTDSELTAETVVNVETVDADRVDTWVAAYIMDVGIVEADPGERVAETTECAFPEDVFVLSMTPHLHKYGTSVKVKHSAGDTMDTLIDVVSWDPYWTQDPRELMLNWGEGEFPVSADDTLRTECEWFNASDAPLQPLQEMCSTFGMFYPATRKYTCIDGEITEQ